MSKQTTIDCVQREASRRQNRMNLRPHAFTKEGIHTGTHTAVVNVLGVLWMHISNNPDLINQRGGGGPCLKLCIGK